MRIDRSTGGPKRRPSTSAATLRGNGSRRRGRAGAGRPSIPASGQGFLSRRRGPWLLALMVLAAAGVIVAVSLTSGGDTTGGADPARVAELRAQEERRLAEQAAELTDLAGRLRDELTPVLDGLDQSLPPKGAPSVASADLAAWRGIVDSAAAKFGDPPSGSTTTNLVRNGLQLSVQLLAASLTAYESAVAADGDQRLGQLAAELRTQAVQAWSIAATQLDLLNIEAGRGHVHVYLPTNGGTGLPDHG